jgi:phosphatidylserine decarboxylase
MERQMSTACGPAIVARAHLAAKHPIRPDHLAEFRRDIRERARKRAANAPRSGVVEELAMLANNDPVLRMHFTRAIYETREAGYELGYSTTDELMVLLDYVMAYASPFSESSLIICPLNALLDWPMCMPSGYALFRDPALNAQLKRVLNYWNGFLSGPYSRTHLNTAAANGWFCPEADKKIGLS